MAKRKAITNEQIGVLIRAQRHSRSISQIELGDAVGVSFQMVQKYETGKTGLTVTRLDEIAIALRCSLSDLLP
jgi:transcriptional regulator with XRE-family HTH domain